MWTQNWVDLHQSCALIKVALHDIMDHHMTRNIKLYKYLDVNGGLMMLHNSNLQFTNATRLNDPFDCHPALFDFSNAPENPYN